MSVPEPRHSKPSRARRLLRLGLVVVSVALVLAVGAFLALQTNTARRYVLDRVIAFLATQNIDLQARSLDYRLDTLAITLNDVAVRGRDLPEGPPVARARRVFVDLSLRELMAGRYVLERGEIVDPDIHIVVDEAGRTNLPRLPERDPAASDEPLDYVLERFAISNGRVRYEDRRQQLDVTLPVSSLTVEGERATARHHLRLAAGPGSIVLQGRRAALDRVTGDIRFDRASLNVEQLDLVAEGSTVSLGGNAITFNDPRYDVSLKATLDVTRLAAFAGLSEPVGGLVRAEVRARGPLTEMAVRTRLHSEDLRFRTLTQMRVTGEATYDMPTRQARLVGLDLVAPVGRVRASGAVSLDATKKGESHLDADLAALDLGRITAALDLPYRAASQAEGHLQARWPGLEYTRATGDARLTLKPTSARPSRGAVPVAGTLTAAASTEKVTLDLRGVRGFGATADGRVSLVERRALSGAVRVRADDLAAVVASAEALLGRRPGTLVGVPVSGALGSDVALSGTIAAPVARATFDAPALRAGELSGIAFSGDAAYMGNAVTIDRADVTWQETQAHARGRLGLTGAQPIVLDATIDRLPVDATLAAAGRGDIPASGSVSMRAAVQGTLARPRGTVSMRGVDLAAYGETLGTLSLDAALANRRVEVTTLRLDKPQPEGNGVLTARGTYDLARQRYDVALTSDQLRLSTLALPDGTPVRGAITMTAEGRGTLNDPAGKANISVTDLRAGEDDLGKVTLDAQLSDRRARLTAEADKFRTTARAEIATVRPYAAAAEVLLNDLDLASLPSTLMPAAPAAATAPAEATPAGTRSTERPLTGTIRARLTGEGPLADPQRGVANATVERLAITWNTQPIETDGPATVRYANQELTIDRLVVRALESVVSVRGTLPLDPRTREGAIDLDGKFDLATLAQYAPSTLGLQAQGDLALVGSIRGSLKRIDPALTLTIGGASVATPTLQPGLSGVAGRVELTQGQLRATDLRAAWGPARLEASAVVPFSWLPATLPIEVPRPDGPAQVRASLAGLDLATLPGVATAAPKLTGLVSIQADVQAATPDPMALTGRVTVPDLHLTFNGLTLAQQGTSTIAIDRGGAQVERFTLNGTLGSVDLTGHIGFLDPRPLDVKARANVNVGVLAAFTDAVRAGGRTNIEVSATGTAAAPVVRGFAELRNGRLSLDYPRLSAESLNARLDVTPERATLSRLEGSLNGGTLTSSGSVDLAGGTPRNLDVRITAADVAFDEPLDLRSLTNADIHITQKRDDFIVSGQVTIQEAGLTNDVNLDTGLFAALTAPRRLDLTEERSPLLERVRFDLNVDTATPIIVDNNLARAEIEADLRVLGTPLDTGLSGRMELLEGSELTLNERTYDVQRGVITFIDERRIVPSFDLQIRTTARKYDIDLQVTGPMDDTQTTLTSSPTLPEPDILALLVTGRTLDEMRGEEFEVAQSQVLSYLGGRVGSQLGRGIERATGLSTVRVEPNLIANEADPTARLTVGQDLAADLRLVYSTDLDNSSDQVWIAEYDVTRQFVSRAVRQSDASYRLDFRHDVRFGGEPEPRRMRRDRKRVASVSIAGTPVLPEPEIRRRLGLEPGDQFDYFKSRKGMDRLARLYREHHHLQARMRLERKVRGDEVDLTLRILAGPTVALAFEGFPVTGDLLEKVETLWQRGVFDTQRVEDVEEEIRGRLVDDKHLEATIEHAIDEAEGARRVTFRIVPGVQFAQVRLAFDGARGIEADELEGVIDDQKLGVKVFTDPESVTDLLQRVYRERGYLDASIETPRYEFDRDARQARVLLPVREGPLFTIRNVNVAGNRVYATPLLLREVPLVRGDPYLPATTEQSLVSLRRLYWSKGYNDARTSYTVALDRRAGLVDVRFAIQEGPRSVVAGIDLAGQDETSQRFVRGQLEVASGEPLDLAALGRSRRNLYDTGAYSLVDITREEVSPPPVEPARGGEPATDEQGATNVYPADAPITQAAAAASAPQAPAAPAPGDKPVRLRVVVREVQPFQFRYGAMYDTERGPGGILDVSNHNSLGKARVLGLRSRYDSQVREGRLYFSQPSLHSLPIETIASIYYREERNPATTIADAFNVDRMGVSIQQERQLRNRYVWNYGYRFERARTYEPDVDVVKPPLQNVSPLTSTFSRETRDDVLDATQGSFVSHAFSFSPTWLGSDRTYIKYFGQYFTYIPLQAPTRKRFTNEILRPRFVYAVGARVGLARGLSDLDVPLSERFLAGGSTTLRGFAQNSVGPIGPNGVPLGGQALIVINNELRFPLMGIVDGVVFADVGNVFDRVSDFTLTDLRESGGVGIRLRTPWFLVRVDYGIPLDHRPGESRSRAFFSIGQAF